MKKSNYKRSDLVADSDLSVKLLCALKKNGITTMGEMKDTFDRYGKDLINMWHFFGARSYRDMEEAVAMVEDDDVKVTDTDNLKDGLYLCRVVGRKFCNYSLLRHDRHGWWSYFNILGKDFEGWRSLSDGIKVTEVVEMVEEDEA